MLVKLVLCLLLQEVLCENLDLLLLHNNDMHGRFEETSRMSGTCSERDKKAGKCYGGFARTAHEIRKYRKLAEDGKGPEVLYLNAGDTYTGTVWFSVHKWRICVEMMNILKPDAASLGNHEFDDGAAGLAPFVNGVNFPIVAANLDFSKEPSLSKVRKSVMLTVKGRKIGIVGHLTTETPNITTPTSVIFNDEVKSVIEESEILNKAGAKIIIVLGHSGYLIDKKIAEQVPLVDIVIGGHTNTFLWNGPPPDLEIPEDLYPKVITQKSGKKVPVVQAYAYTKYLGVLNTTFDGNGDLIHFMGQPILLDNSIPQDPDVLNVLETYRKQVDEVNTKVAGKSRVVLEGQSCRSRECNFGNMIADAFVMYAASTYYGKYWTDVPIGFYNGGGIRNSIDPTKTGGNVTRGELLGSIPFGNQLIRLTLKGSDLIKTLEIGVRSNGETSMGEFLQFSGLHVVYDRSKPAGSRVVSAKARCGQCGYPEYAPVEPHKNYTIVTTSFLADGGDGHKILKENGVDRRILDLGDVDAVQWYLESRTIVYPENQERIIFVSHNGDGSFSSRSIPNTFLLAFLLFSKMLIFK